MNDLMLDGLMVTNQNRQASQMTNATARSGPVNLQLDGISFADHYVVLVNGAPISAALPTRTLAEQFVSQLPVMQQQLAQIVPATQDGRQVLLG